MVMIQTMRAGGNDDPGEYGTSESDARNVEGIYTKA